jgi:hypothetical protein
LQVRARSASAIEHAGTAFVSESTVNQRPDEPTEAAEPEMTFFSARSRAQQIVHAALYLFCDN